MNNGPSIFRHHPFTCCLLAAFLAVCGPGSRAGAAQEIRFEVIDGKLCAPCIVKSASASIPANVVIDKAWGSR